jgi:lysozyme
MSYLEEFKQELEKDEGRVRHAYQDSLGYWTIGVGRLIDKRLGGGLRDDEINYLLNNDVEEAHVTAQKLVKNFDDLTSNRKAVILHLAFNLGYTKLAKFVNTLKAVNEGRWEDAARGMENSLWYKQVGNRSKRLVKLMREG